MAVASKFTLAYLSGDQTRNPKAFTENFRQAGKCWKVINFHKNVTVVKKKKMKSTEKISGGR